MDSGGLLLEGRVVSEASVRPCDTRAASSLLTSFTFQQVLPRGLQELLTVKEVKEPPEDPVAHSNNPLREKEKEKGGLPDLGGVPRPKQPLPGLVAVGSLRPHRQRHGLRVPHAQKSCISSNPGGLRGVSCAQSALSLTWRQRPPLRPEASATTKLRRHPMPPPAGHCHPLMGEVGSQS